MITDVMERKREPSAIDALVLLNFASTINPFHLAKLDYIDRHDFMEAAWLEAGIHPNSAYGTLIKLSQGLSDTNDIVKNAFDDHKLPIGRISALAIARHQTSIDTIAYAAQLGERTLSATNRDQYEHNRYVEGTYSKWQISDSVANPTFARRFIIDDSIGAIVQNHDFDDSWESRTGSRGCPFAYGDAERPKVFDKFTKWAATIAVLDYYRTK